ncbi:MAG: phage portal protein [Sandarakinorhabdus sp.]|jgi:HK97 family phage portal protein|nr:phage portal protein [Sandarakinorhabdus sp.]
MRILGFEIRRAAPARSEQRSFWSQVQVWRQQHNFTASTDGTISSPRRAMGVPAVYACVDKIAKTNATLPKFFVDEQDPDRPRPLKTTPLSYMVGQRPNNYQTAYNFWHIAYLRKLLWGNFYAEIQRDARSGEAVALFPLLSQDVVPEYKAGKKIYRVGGRELADEDIFHLMAPGFNGIEGLSVIAMHRATVETAVEMQAFTEGFYRNGAKFSGVAKHPGELGAEAAARLREQISEIWQGASNAGKIAVLEEGMSFEALSMPLGDAEFIATRRYGVAEIARMFDMPLHKLSEMDGAKYNNVEQGQISYVIDCIEPHIEQAVQEANIKLPAERDRGRVKLRMPTEELLQGDLPSRMQALGAGRQWGIFTINEARRRLGLPSIGPEGDQVFTPGNANAAQSTAGQLPGNTEE